MTVETVLSCPLGSKCEEIKDNKLHRCTWYVQLAGKNPTTGHEVDEKGCAMSWLPILLVENSMQQRSTAAAVESFRNEMVAAGNVPTANAANRNSLLGVITSNSTTPLIGDNHEIHN